MSCRIWRISHIAHHFDVLVGNRCCTPFMLAAAYAQVGHHTDACMLTLRTRAPTSPAIVELCHAVRLRLCRELGGRHVDFVLYASAVGDGSTLLNLVPVAVLSKNSSAPPAERRPRCRDGSLRGRCF